MKKLFIASIVVALVAITVPVWAQLDQICDVSLDGQVTFTKTVSIDQTRNDYYQTNINKCLDPKARADAEAVKNDLNYDNCLVVGASTFSDYMDSSFSGFVGIGQSNQAAGQMNNQGNVVAVGFVANTDTYSSALTAVGVSNKDNHYYGNRQNATVEWWCPRDQAVLTQTDTLSNSFNFFIGIGQSNQSAGSMNNQNNAVSVAAGVAEGASTGGMWGGFHGSGSMVAVAASELAMTNTSNTFVIDKANFSNSMTGSFNSFTGIGQSNQSAGNMNNQCNVVSVAATVAK